MDNNSSSQPGTRPPSGLGAKLNIANLVASILSVVVLGVLSYVGRSIVDEQKAIRLVQHENVVKLARIEAIRYTAADALRDRRQAADQVSELRAWIEANYPPPWLREQMSELKEEIRSLRMEVIKLKAAASTKKNDRAQDSDSLAAKRDSGAP